MDYKDELEEKNLKGRCSCCCFSALVLANLLFCLHNSGHKFLENTFQIAEDRYTVLMFTTKDFLDISEIIFSTNKLLNLIIN